MHQIYAKKDWFSLHITSVFHPFSKIWMLWFQGLPQLFPRICPGKISFYSCQEYPWLMDPLMVSIPGGLGNDFGATIGNRQEIVFFCNKHHQNCKWAIATWPQLMWEQVGFQPGGMYLGVIHQFSMILKLFPAFIICTVRVCRTECYVWLLYLLMISGSFHILKMLFLFQSWEMVLGSLKKYTMVGVYHTHNPSEIDTTYSFWRLVGSLLSLQVIAACGSSWDWDTPPSTKPNRHPF